MNFDIYIAIGEIMIGIGAIAAISLGLHEYRKGQRWEKAKILLTLIDSFENDDQIALACQMLDWDDFELSISKNSDAQFQFSNEMLISSLRVVLMDSQKEFSKEEKIIRDAFDVFFDYFHKLYAFERSGLLKMSDYTYFNYWFELLRDIGNYKKNPSIQTAIDNYIIHYRFVGIEFLLKEYSLTPDPLLLFKYE